MLLLRQFNKKFSIRKDTEFTKPRIIQLQRLQIPRGSILHTIDLDRNMFCIPVSTPYLQELEKPAYVRHHKDLNADHIIGTPIHVPVQGQKTEMYDFHRKNRYFRLMSDPRNITDIKTLLIENYTPMLPWVRYPDTIMAWYDRLYNIIATVATQIKQDAKDFTDRQNYMILNIGNRLPSYEKFKTTYNYRVKNKLEHFDSYELLWLLELFGWFRGDVENGLFDDLSPAELGRINFIFTHNAGFFNMNLGMVNRFRKSDCRPHRDDSSFRIRGDALG